MSPVVGQMYASVDPMQQMFAQLKFSSYKPDYQNTDMPYVHALEINIGHIAIAAIAAIDCQFMKVPHKKGIWVSGVFFIMSMASNSVTKDIIYILGVFLYE